MELEPLLFIAAVIVGILIIVGLVFGGATQESWVAATKFLDKSGLENLGAVTTRRSGIGRLFNNDPDQLILLIVAGKRLMMQRYALVPADQIGGIRLSMTSATGGGAQIIDDGTYELDDSDNSFMIFDDKQIYLHLVQV